MAAFGAMNADFPPAFGDPYFLLAGRALEILIILPVLDLFTAGVHRGGITVRIAIVAPAEQPLDPLFKPLIAVQLFLTGMNVPGQRPVEGKGQGQDADQPDNGVHPAVHNPNKKAAHQ